MLNLHETCRVRGERNLTTKAKGEGLEASKKGPIRKRTGKSTKQLAKRERRQSVNQADKPVTDTDHAVETTQQLVTLKKSTDSRKGCTCTGVRARTLSHRVSRLKTLLAAM